MSMNLHCEQMDLWQTPTHITYMCYSNEDGGWEGIRYRYLEWVRSSLNGVWEDEFEYEQTKNRINSHIKEVMSYDTLNFYIM